MLNTWIKHVEPKIPSSSLLVSLVSRCMASIFILTDDYRHLKANIILISNIDVFTCMHCLFGVSLAVGSIACATLDASSFWCFPSWSTSLCPSLPHLQYLNATLNRETLSIFPMTHAFKTLCQQVYLVRLTPDCTRLVLIAPRSGHVFFWKPHAHLQIMFLMLFFISEGCCDHCQTNDLWSTYCQLERISHSWLFLPPSHFVVD